MIGGAECDFFKRKQAPAGEDELVGGELALALAGAERVCEHRFSDLEQKIWNL